MILMSDEEHRQMPEPQEQAEPERCNKKIETASEAIHPVTPSSYMDYYGLPAHWAGRWLEPRSRGRRDVAGIEVLSARVLDVGF